MFNKKELRDLLLVALVISLVITLSTTIGNFGKILLYSFLGILIVLFINSIGKKIMAYHYESGIEIKLWEFQRYGLKPWMHLAKPFPLGLILPILFSALTLGHFYWMGTLVFDASGKIYKAARRHGLYKFSEITENQIGNIAIAGILANLFMAFVFYLINQPTLSRLSIYYASFQIIPLGNLDGSKIFFGNGIVKWGAIVALCIIGLGYAFLLI
jgi:hypothetical protein